MWFYVNFCFLHGQKCMTSFQISYSLKVYHDDENWKKQQPTLHNVLGVDVHFQQHIKNSCLYFCWMLILDCKIRGHLLLRAPQIVLLLFWGVHHDPRSDGLRLKHEHNTKPMALTGWFCEKKRLWKANSRWTSKLLNLIFFSIPFQSPLFSS